MNCEDNDFLDSAWTAYRRPWFLADGSRGDATINLVGDGNVTTAMGNVIVGAPLGAVRPYASGGLGLIATRVDSASQFLTNVTSNEFGTNIGGGFFAFAGKWGARGDIRYYNTSTNDPGKNLTGTPSDTFTQALLSGLSFWRGNLGVAYRW